MTNDEKQAEYETRQRIRRGYLDSAARRELERRSSCAPEERHYYMVSWMPPLSLRAIGKFEAAAAEPVVAQTMTYVCYSSGPAWVVTCEGYLVDKWWREGDSRDISHMGR